MSTIFLLLFFFVKFKRFHTLYCGSRLTSASELGTDNSHSLARFWSLITQSLSVKYLTGETVLISTYWGRYNIEDAWSNVQSVPILCRHRHSASAKEWSLLNQCQLPREGADDVALHVDVLRVLQWNYKNRDLRRLCILLYTSASSGCAWFIRDPVFSLYKASRYQL